MGAENSKENNPKKNAITVNHLEQALEKQRKLYEIQTQKLLVAQKAELTKKQAIPSVPQTTANVHNANVAAGANTLYPNLASTSHTTHMNNYYNQQTWSHINQRTQPITPPTSPSAPPVPTLSLIETQQSASALPPVPRTLAGPSYPMRMLTTQQVRGTNNVFKPRCPNWSDGCSLHFEEEELETHLLECPFKDLTCPINTIFECCSWKGKINQLVTHFDEHHQECRRTKVNKEDTLHIGTNYRFVQLVDEGNFNFLLHVNVDRRTNKILLAIQLLGTKFSASKWTYELRVYNKKEPRRLFEYIDTCFSNTDSFETLRVENKTAEISLDYAKTFAVNGLITYKIFLRRAFTKNSTDNKNRNNQFTQNKITPRKAGRSQQKN